MSAIIKVEGLTKKYRLGTVGTTSLAEELHEWWDKVRGKEQEEIDFYDNPLKGKIHWAIKEMSFEVKPGEVLGIIGKNGAGKSTLLKILSKVTTPTSGSIKIRGKIASLLEVGTGFHGELSGRENIYLNGAILGMDRKETERKLEEIVEFSGVQKFIDTPVKRYSSGMYVRLAFAVAAHLDPDILIVDEVLAVGDVEFQKKCLGKMKDVSQNQGRTVLFVSHNMGAVKGLCSRCLLLSDGRITDEGDPSLLTSKYLKGNSETEGVFVIGANADDKDLLITKVTILNQNGQITQDFNIGDDLVVKVDYLAPARINKPYFWISIMGKTGTLFSANSLIDGNTPDHAEGPGSFTATFKNIKLLPQTYTIWTGARDFVTTKGLTSSKEVGEFNIMTKISDLGFSQLAERIAFESAPVLTDYSWDFGNNDIRQVKSDSYVKR